MSDFVKYLMFFGCLTPLMAQLLPAASANQFWDDGRVVSKELYNQREIEIFEPRKQPEGKGSPQKIAIPPGFHFRWFEDGVAYFQGHAQGTSSDKKVLFSFKSGQWNQMATYDLELPLRHFVPLKNGSFFLMTDYFPFEKDGKGSPFAIAKPNSEGRLEIQSLENLVFKEPLWTGPRNKPHPATNGIGDIVLGSRPQKVPNGFVLVAAEAGFLFVFSREDGRLLRTSKVFPSIDEKRLEGRQGQYERAILCVQPRPNGHLLLATRTEDAATYSTKVFATRANPNIGKKIDPRQANDEYAALVEENAKISAKALEAFPEVQYWDFNPITGDFFQENTPQGLPSKILNEAMYRKFRFRMKPDGEPEVH